MSKSKIMDIVTLTREGWRPYDAVPDKKVYEGIGCEVVLSSKKSRVKPFWFVREDVFCCIGCPNHCTLKRPTGFPMPLPINYPPLPHDRQYQLTPKEMMARLNVLNAKQAAYCLNVSERTIYNYIAEGRLPRLRDNPVRVRASDVRDMAEDFDE